MPSYSFKWSTPDADDASIVVRNGAGTIVATGTTADVVAVTNEAFVTYTVDLPAGDTYTATATVLGRSRSTVGVLDTAGALSATFAGVILFTDPRIGGKGDGVTDNVAAWNTAMALLAGKGGTLFFPQGIYCFGSEPNDVPGGVLLRGTGFNYSDPTAAAPKHGSVLRATAAMTRFVKLSPYGSAGQSGDTYTGAAMEDLVVDGRDLADNVVTTQGRRNEIRNCQIYWGNLRAVDIQGQNTYIRGGVQCQHDKGDVITINWGGDHKILDAQQRQPGTTGACIRVAGNASMADILIRGNHMWTGANAVAAAAEGLIVIQAPTGVALPNISIVGNIIEGIIGPAIKVVATNQVRSLLIANNMFFNANSSTSNAVMLFDTGGVGSVVSTTITGNVVEGYGTSSPYKAFIELVGFTWDGSSTRWNVSGNVGTYVNAIVSPASGQPINRFRQFGNSFRTATATVNSEGSGTVSLNGDGTTTVFNIPHLLDGTPRSYGVDANSAVAAAAHYATVDATNVIVTYTTAPAAGTGNVKLSWHAER